jgi:hypothetical protein
MVLKADGSPPPSPSASSSAAAGEAAGASKFSSSSGGTSVGKVFMGEYGDPLAGKNLDYLSPAAQAQLARRKIPTWVTSDEADAAYFNWTDKQRADFKAKAMVGGLLKFGDGEIEASKLWHNLVLQSAAYGTQDKAVTPMDILSGYVKANDPNSPGAWVTQGNFQVNQVTGERRYIGPQFRTTTDQRIDLTDPATARAIAVKLFQDLMGRDPGRGEVGTFANALAQAEEQNPTQQSTTTQFDSNGEAVNTQTFSQGGMTAEGRAQIASDQIKGKKEYGAVQAATTYSNALENAVYGAPH